MKGLKWALGVLIPIAFLAGCSGGGQTAPRVAAAPRVTFSASPSPEMTATEEQEAEATATATADPTQTEDAANVSPDVFREKPAKPSATTTSSRPSGGVIACSAVIKTIKYKNGRSMYSAMFRWQNVKPTAYTVNFVRTGGVQLDVMVTFKPVNSTAPFFDFPVPRSIVAVKPVASIKTGLGSVDCTTLAG